MRTITHLIVHHSASPRDITTLQEITAWHLERGFQEIGYHWVIDAKGRIHRGRHWTLVGAHCKGMNRQSLGVCLAGNNTDPKEGWNQAQASSLGFLVDALRLLWKDIKVQGHRDHSTTLCPGLDISTLEQAGWILPSALL